MQTIGPPPCCHTPEETGGEERPIQPFDAPLHAGPVCAVSTTTTMMALRITCRMPAVPRTPGENGRRRRRRRGREGGRRGGEGREEERRGRGAKSGFKLRDNVVAPRRPQRAGWVRLLNDSAQILSLSNTGGRTDADGRTDHNVARRERQFTSRLLRGEGNAHMSIRWAGGREAGRKGGKAGERGWEWEKIN